MNSYKSLTQTTPNKSITTSVDVENLFTNVSVYEIIKIIIENVYNHPYIPPPTIQPKILEKFLIICTTKVPFYDPSGNIYIQIDGISMGSYLGITVSVFYMSYIENKIFKTVITKPKIYIRNIDDIFIATYSYEEINKLKQTLKKKLRTKFNYRTQHW